MCAGAGAGEGAGAVCCGLWAGDRRANDREWGRSFFWGGVLIFGL